MKESVFQREFKESFKAIYGKHYIKIPDQPRFSGERSHFAAPRPYDAYCLLDKFIAIEFKQQKSFTGIPFDAIRDNQIDNLLEVENSGHIGLIVINYRCNNVSLKYQKNYSMGKRYNKAFIMSISYFLTLRDTIFDDRKSIPFDAFYEEGDLNIVEISKDYKVEGQSGYFWDIRCLEDISKGFLLK